PNIRYELALGGGATMDLGCYGLNMLRFFSLSTPEVVRASAVLGPPEIDLAMDAELALPDGVRASMKCSMMPKTQVSVFFRAVGSNGLLHVTNPVAPQIGHVLTIWHDVHESREFVPGASTFVYQLRAFAQAVRGGQSLTTGPDEALANMKLVD